MKQRAFSPAEVMYFWSDAGSGGPSIISPERALELDPTMVVPVKSFTWPVCGGPMAFRAGVAKSVGDPQARVQMRELGLIR